MDDPFDGNELEDVLMIEAIMGWDGVQCGTCGQLLGSDPEDEPEGDDGLPICGECNRARKSHRDGTGSAT